MRPSWHYITVVLLLLGLTVLLQHTSRAEHTPDRLPFAAFPLELSGHDASEITWMGRDMPLEPEILSVLKVDDYMMRLYVPSTHKATASGGVVALEPSTSGHAPVWLYVGYYRTQRTGVTYHSPLNCLPGSGWNIMSRELVRVRLDDGATLPVNQVVIQKGLETQVILYWYQDRGRSITSEYWAKGYLLLDAMIRNRTDGALVRISVPVTSSGAERWSVQDAVTIASQFLRSSYPRLMEHLPV
jgi:EpsI family protein